MAQIQTNNTADKKRKYSYKPAALKVDMTPMVDLGFLLITFFIVTTTLSAQKATDLLMPKEGIPSPVKESQVLTLLLDGNEKVYVYAGSWENAHLNKWIEQLSWKSKEQVRNIITAKQTALGNHKNDLMVLIKPATKSQYQNVIDALDEMLINNVKRYAVVDLSDKELAYVNSVVK